MTLDFSQNYTLEDDRVFLRPLVDDDFLLLYPFAMNEPELWTYSMVSAAGEIGMQSYLNNALDNLLNAQESCLLEIVVAKEENVFPMMPTGASVSEIRLS